MIFTTPSLTWLFHWVVVSNIFYFHPYLGKWSNLTNIFQMGWNHQLVHDGVILPTWRQSRDELLFANLAANTQKNLADFSPMVS